MQPLQTSTPPESTPRNEIVWSNTPAQANAPVQPLDAAQPAQPYQQAPATHPARTYWVDGSAEGPTISPVTSRASQIIYLLLGIGEAFMIARVALKLLAANSEVGFVRFVYGVSAPLVAPFRGIFPTPTGDGSVVELSSLVAIAVYALIAWAIVRLVLILGRQPATPAAR